MKPILSSLALLFALLLIPTALAAPSELRPITPNTAPTSRTNALSTPIASATATANTPTRTPFQISSPGLRPPNTTTNGETEILSKSAQFDLKARTVVYVGDVRVRDPRMELSCERLTVRLGQQAQMTGRTGLQTQTGGRFESITAETNVNIEVLDERGQPYHCTGGRATYIYSKDLMELTDNPRVKTSQGVCYGDVIVYDRATSNIRVTNPRTEFIAPSGNR